MNTFTNIISTAIDAGAVIVYAGMGELLLERTGVLNLGLEGIIAIAAASAVIAAQWATTPFQALAIAILVGAAMGVLFMLVTVVFRANQVLSGLALFLVGVGMAGHLGGSVTGNPSPVTFEAVPIPLLSEIPHIGPMFFEHDPLVYFGYVALPIIVWFVLNRTRHGVNLRAIGEEPSAGDATGVSVMGIRAFYTVLGGALAGVGGATLSLAFTPGWTPNVVAGRGWIALAVVIFAMWRPWRLVVGATLFGALISVSFIAQDRGWDIPGQVLNMLPYLITLALIVLAVVRNRGTRATVAPAALAVPFFREER
ncbi:MAG: ABC transporter permease [Acidimicrobiia bacterium]|nr:ABC transporter permease [Acidimicrobiia bacterium]